MSALKIVLPLFIVAIAFVVLVPILLIWFVNDLEQNVTVTGSGAGVWTVFTHGLEMVTKIIGESSFAIAVILVLIALVLLLGSVVIVVKRMAS